MSRLFISHSSADNVAAVAFKQWLSRHGWPKEDVFLDLDNIGGGARWKEELRKANARCEAVILLASPDSLKSPECLAEIRTAENFRKEIIVVLLHDVQLDDARLASFTDRQIPDLSAPPQSHVERIDYRGQRHNISFNPDALTKIAAYLNDRGISPDHFGWPPTARLNAEPFPGLRAYCEDEAGIFFGRDGDILLALDHLRALRRNGRSRCLIIEASSGAGKSSFMRAGLWPRLGRDPDCAPLAILRPAQGIIIGPDGLGHTLAKQLRRPGQPVNPGTIHAGLMAADMMRAAAEFANLLAKASAQAHEPRRTAFPNSGPPMLMLAVDQAEELFAPDDAKESHRFLSLLGHVMTHPQDEVALFCLFTIRLANVDKLCETLIDLGVERPETFRLLPVSATSYRDVIEKPLKVLARGEQRLTMEPLLVDQLAKDATGADALPLLAFTLSYLYREFGPEGTITLEQYKEKGGVSGSIQRAVEGALARPGNEPAIPAAKAEQDACLRATFIPWLAQIDAESGLAMRRVARLDGFVSAARAMVRRLIEARLLVEQTGTVEVAHESLLREWPPLKVWLNADAEDLRLLQGVELAARDWTRHGADENWLVHQGTLLAAAERSVARDDFRGRLGDEAVAYLKACRDRETKSQIAQMMTHARESAHRLKEDWMRRTIWIILVFVAASIALSFLLRG